MKLNEIKAIVKKVGGSSINEFVLHRKDISIRVSKSNITHPPPVTISGEHEQEHSIERVDEKVSDNLSYFKSSWVGIYHDYINSKNETGIYSGVRVNPGDKLGIIRTMNINVSIIAEEKMLIKDILIKDGHSVEYDQALYQVEYI